MTGDQNTSRTIRWCSRCSPSSQSFNVLSDVLTVLSDSRVTEEDSCLNPHAGRSASTETLQQLQAADVASAPGARLAATPMASKRPVLIYLHRNGERVEPGVGKTLLVMPGMMSVDELKAEAAAKLGMPAAARALFSIDGSAVADMDQIEKRMDLVVCPRGDEFRSHVLRPEGYGGGGGGSSAKGNDGIQGTLHTYATLSDYRSASPKRVGHMGKQSWSNDTSTAGATRSSLTQSATLHPVKTEDDYAREKRLMRRKPGIPTRREIADRSSSPSGGRPKLLYTPDAALSPRAGARSPRWGSPVDGGRTGAPSGGGRGPAGEGKPGWNSGGVKQAGDASARSDLSVHDPGSRSERNSPARRSRAGGSQPPTRDGGSTSNGKLDGNSYGAMDRPHESAMGKFPLPDKAGRDALFSQYDYNGNGSLSLAEIDKAVEESFPHFNNKPALMRAYKAADVDGNGWVGRREFRILLQYLAYFNDLWSTFGQIDDNMDGRLELAEFQVAGELVGVKMSASEADGIFRSIDANGGGYILFDEFCAWSARRTFTGSDDATAAADGAADAYAAPLSRGPAPKANSQAASSRAQQIREKKQALLERRQQMLEKKQSLAAGAAREPTDGYASPAGEGPVSRSAIPVRSAALSVGAQPLSGADSSRLQEMEGQLVAEKAEVAAQKAKMDREKRSLAKKQAEISQMEAELEADKTSIEEEKIKLASTKQELLRQRQSVAADKKKIDGSKSTSGGEVSDLRKQVDDLKASLEQSSEDYMTLRSKLLERESHSDGLNEELSARKQNAQELEQYLISEGDNLEQRLAEFNVDKKDWAAKRKAEQRELAADKEQLAQEREAWCDEKARLEELLRQAISEKKSAIKKWQKRQSEPQSPAPTSSPAAASVGAAAAAFGGGEPSIPQDFLPMPQVPTAWVSSAGSPQSQASPGGGESPVKKAWGPPSDVVTSRFEGRVEADEVKALKKKLRASAMSFGGVDWGRLFKQYDRDNSGDLDFEEFRGAVRKNAKISQNDMTDQELYKIFCSVDDDQSGTVDAEEFAEWLDANQEQYKSKKVNMQNLLSTGGARTLGSGGGSATRAKRLGAHEAKDMKMIRDKLQAAAEGLGGKKAWANIFKKYDRDNSGEIDFKEFRSAVRKSARISASALSDRELQVLFDYVDADSSGELSIGEFNDWLDGKISKTRAKQDWKKGISAVISLNKFSAAGTAFLQLSPEEQEDMMLLKKKLRAASYTAGGEDWHMLFKQYDRDNSGDLDYEEFTSAVRKDAKIPPDGPDGMSDKELRKLFRQVDVDGGGSVEVEELIDWLKGSETAYEKKRISNIPKMDTGLTRRQQRRSRSSKKKKKQEVQYGAGEIRPHEIIAMKKKLNEAATTFGGTSLEKEKLEIDKSTSGAVVKASVDMLDAWKAIFKKYDADGSGELDFGEFRSAVRKSAHISQSGPNGIPDKDLHAIFAMVDIDGSDLVDQKEFTNWLSDTSNKTPKQRLAAKAIKDAATKAAGGTVRSDIKVGFSDKKLTTIRKKIRSTAYTAGGMDFQALFKQYDKDNSGELDFREFKAAIRKSAHIPPNGPNGLSDKELHGLFKAVDTDRGGEICIDEFTNFLDGVSEKAGRHRTSTHHGTRIDMGQKMKGGGKRKSPRRKLRDMPSMDSDVMQQFELPSKSERNRLFDRYDFNGNGILSLAEIDKVVTSSFPQFNNKAVLMRAYKAADRNGNGWVDQREFRLLLAYMGYFNDLWAKFRRIDTNNDGRLEIEEFFQAANMLSLEASDTEFREMVSEEAFIDMDDNRGGYVLFDEFCSWCARKAMNAQDGADADSSSDDEEEFSDGIPQQQSVSSPLPVERRSDPDADAERVKEMLADAHHQSTPTSSSASPRQQSASSSHCSEYSPSPSPKQSKSGKHAGLRPAEKTVPDWAQSGPTQAVGGKKTQDAYRHVATTIVVPPKAERDSIFDAMDYNGNGFLSLTEVDKAVQGLFPQFDNKPAIMRAFQSADVDGNGFLRRNEFRLLLQYLNYFNNLWDRFESMDSDGDRRLDVQEFQTLAHQLGISGSAAGLKREFTKMDADGGGLVLFEEFCSWSARRQKFDDDTEDAADEAAEEERRQSGGGEPEPEPTSANDGEEHAFVVGHVAGRSLCISCANFAELQCPVCEKNELPAAWYCSQSCFESDWKAHKKYHPRKKK